MDVFLEHVEAHQNYYVAGGILLLALLPLVYVTRRYSVPMILYAIETVIYIGLMHFGVGLIARVAAWFKDQSSMKRAFGTQQAETPDWSNPWLAFWDRSQYNPDWLFWAEVALAALIVFLVWRLRPVRVRRRPKAPPPKPRPGTYSYNTNPARKGWGGRR